jgi:hypothetical protein
LFIVRPLLTELLRSNLKNFPRKRRRNAVPGAYDKMNPSSSLQQVLGDATTPENLRHVSGRSERSAASVRIEYSLWRDPELEEKL